MPAGEQMLVQSVWVTTPSHVPRGQPMRSRPVARGMEVALGLASMHDATPQVKRTLRDNPDLICLSHLRWQFVFQRPQHLMIRYARNRRVFFVEEPVYEDASDAHVTMDVHDGVHVIVPHLPRSMGET